MNDDVNWLRTSEEDVRRNRRLVDDALDAKNGIKIWDSYRLVAVLSESDYFEEKLQEKQSDAISLYLYVSAEALQRSNTNKNNLKSAIQNLSNQLGKLAKLNSVFLNIGNTRDAMEMLPILHGISNLPIHSLFICTRVNNNGFWMEQSLHLGDAISRFSSLEYFSMKDHDASDDILAALCSNTALPRIKSIAIKSSYKMNRYMLQNLLLRDSLHCVELHGPLVLPLLQIHAISVACRQRAKPLHLSMPTIGVAPDSTRWFVQAMLETEKITSVSLSANTMMIPRGLFYKEIQNCLQSNYVKVKSLELTLGDSDSRCVEVGAAGLIISSIQPNASIENLQLRNFMWDDQFSDSLVTTLNQTKTLKSLCLAPLSLDNERFEKLLPSLGRNKTLEMLTLKASVSLSASVCLDMAQYLNTNTILQSLTIFYTYHEWSEISKTITPEDYIRCIKLLKDNTTLTQFSFLGSKKVEFNESQYKSLLVAASQNFGLTRHDCVTRESVAVVHEAIAIMEDPDDPEVVIPNLEYSTPTNKELEVIQELNKAGRRYLKDDPNNIRKGCDVLINVIDDLDAIFYHLKENPILCDRTKVGGGANSPVFGYSNANFQHRTHDRSGSAEDEDKPDRKRPRLTE